LANLDIVYTPKFDTDRYIDGGRLSYWNSQTGSLAGNNAIVHTDKPNRGFAMKKSLQDSIKISIITKRPIWLSWLLEKPRRPEHCDDQAIFPSLYVFGASVRGTIGKGIGNLEAGYYDSTDDSDGSNPLINNSEMRYLAGYTQEIGKDLTMGLQYYVEQMLDYNAYLRSLPSGPARDRYRNLATLRLTKLLMNQDLRLSLFNVLFTNG